jgi:hypothetical protein
MYYLGYPQDNVKISSSIFPSKKMLCQKFWGYSNEYHSLYVRTERINITLLNTFWIGLFKCLRILNTFLIVNYRNFWTYSSIWLRKINIASSTLVHEIEIGNLIYRCCWYYVDYSRYFTAPGLEIQFFRSSSEVPCIVFCNKRSALCTFADGNACQTFVTCPFSLCR